MDPLSICASSIAILSLIASTSTAISSFVRTVRESRSDLNEVDRELHSIKSVLELIRDDFDPENEDAQKKNLPLPLQEQIHGILECCSQAIKQIEGSLVKYRNLLETKSLSGQFRWALNGKPEIQRTRATLEPNRRALEIAVDVMTYTTVKEIKSDTTALLDDTAVLKDNTARILEEIGKLQEQLPQNLRDPASEPERGFLLDRYLENLTTFTESIQVDVDSGLGMDGDAGASEAPTYTDPHSELRSTSEEILKKMGFVSNASTLPYSFRLAIQNRFTIEELNRGKPKGKGKKRHDHANFKEDFPFFVIGAFMYPSTIRALVCDEASVAQWRNMPNLSKIVSQMTPATLRGYQRYAVSHASWPALLPSIDPSDSITGMLFYTRDAYIRQKMQHFQGGMFELNRANVEIELHDGSSIFQEAAIYVWNGDSDQLIDPEERVWRPEDMLKGKWLSDILKRVDAEEEQLQIANDEE